MTSLDILTLYLLLYLLPAIVTHYHTYWYARTDFYGERIDDNEYFVLDSHYYIDVLKCYIPIYNLFMSLLGILVFIAIGVVYVYNNHIEPILSKKLW